MTDFLNQPDTKSAAFMKAAAPPQVRLAFITTDKEQRLDVGRKLAAGFSPALLQDAEAPVMVAIDGTFKSGKAIVPDVVREALLGKEAAFTGQKTYQESWIGEIKGQPVEIGFINAGHRDPAPFLQQRTAGGITFVNNDLRHEAGTPGLEIWIESPASAQATRAYKSSLADTFADQALKEDSEWVRYVEIKVTDPRLLLSKPFQSALRDIAAGFPDAKTSLPKASAEAAAVKTRKPTLTSPSGSALTH